MYQYKLNKSGQFRAKKFIESQAQIKLDNNGNASCDEIMETDDYINILPGFFYFGKNKKLYAYEFIEE